MKIQSGAITEYLEQEIKKSLLFLFPLSFSVVSMLKSLHQLQEENRRLEEQIKTLTMKKERLQLLSAQLSVPFTPATASSGTQTLLLTYLEIKVNDAHQ